MDTENLEEEVVEKVVEEEIVEEEIVEEELGEDGKPIKVIEDWMNEDDEQTLSDIMPVSAHIRAKRKLKGKIGDRDTEIESLRQEIKDLKDQKIIPSIQDETLIRPKESDYEFLEAYHTALDEYEDKRIESKFSVVQGKNKLQETQKKVIQQLNENVDKHYIRADKLIEDSGISAETYKQSDETVKGSEKVMYKLGRSKALRGELITLLSEDPHGLRAIAFLGEQKAKLLNTKGRKSNAPAPSNEVTGDATSSTKERGFRKKYDDAHVKNNSQAAYNAKKEAKAAGIDTSKW
ncbi:MAG: hypothetical protein ACTSPO_15300 [Candidatus Heimdallarchaeaceae archaeon]